MFVEKKENIIETILVLSSGVIMGYLAGCLIGFALKELIFECKKRLKENKEEKLKEEIEKLEKELEEKKKKIKKL